MQAYHELLQRILTEGTLREDRTGTGTLSVFGHQLRFDLRAGFPLVTTKAVSFRLIASELLWFLTGSTNIQPLLRQDNHIWDDWPWQRYQASPAYAGESREAWLQRVMTDDAFAATWGELGPVYGKQWRDWTYVRPDGSVGHVDQLQAVVDGLRQQPSSRRHVVVAYHPGEVEHMLLPPCHSLFQFYVADGRLSCQLYQRSGDVGLGVPFNIASYALLTHLLAQTCGYEVGEFVHTLGDAHLYLNHLEQVRLQLTRTPLPLPTLHLNPAVTDLFAFTLADLELRDYHSHPAIRMPVSV